MPPNVWPEGMWNKAIQTQANEIGKLEFVSDLMVETHPNDPFPVPGLNPDVKVQGTAAKDLPAKHHLKDSSGALWKRERTGFGLIQFTLNQPGFTYIDARVSTERLRIAPRFLIRIFVPRDYPTQGVGYAFTFSDDENFELPHYPNIMRRSDSGQHGYWDNVGLFGNIQMVEHFPEGAMCLNALNEKGTRLSDIVSRVKNYLSVPLDIWEGFDGKIKNDRGFDHQLYEYYKTNARTLNIQNRNLRPQYQQIVPVNYHPRHLHRRRAEVNQGTRIDPVHREDYRLHHLLPDDVDRADEI